MVRHYLAAQHWEAGVDELLACLNPWLMANWQTAIVAAVDEPFYQPADFDHPIAEIQFAHGYFNSVLHELAHWCVAGAERRKLPDFGYWYEPDGRTAEQQALFEKVEIKPQALEWHFAQACGRPFKVSVDNLSGEPTDPQPFQRAVAKQASAYQQVGLPARPAQIVDLLCERFRTQRSMFNFHCEA